MLCCIKLEWKIYRVLKMRKNFLFSFILSRLFDIIICHIKSCFFYTRIHETQVTNWDLLNDVIFSIKDYHHHVVSFCWWLTVHFSFRSQLVEVRSSINVWHARNLREIMKNQNLGFEKYFPHASPQAAHFTPQKFLLSHSMNFELNWTKNLVSNNKQGKWEKFCDC